jgi:DNA-binding protein H-NS
MAKTFVQVQKQIEQLQKQADQLRKKEAEGVLARIQEAISVYGFSADDFDFSGPAQRAGTARKAVGKRGPKAGAKAAAKTRVKAKASPAAPKYKDDQGHTWGGRGPRPAWFKAALEAGKTPEELLA